jgi:imidazole glycerol-phosphate synthase subunit HisF
MHNNIRIIPRLDIKNKNLIKGINLEGLRVMGDPNKFAIDYYNQGADEILFMDCVASLYGRNSLNDIIKNVVKNIFIPITVGGGIRSVNDVSLILNSGADKVAINSAAVKNPELIKKIANKFGSQCFVLSIEAKKIDNNKWEVYINNGREKTGIDVFDWIKIGCNYGAGEILLTSIDNEGTRKGLDLELIKAAARLCKIPLIVSGGVGKEEHIMDVIKVADVDAIAIADILHYKRSTIKNIKNFLRINF